MSTDAKPSNVRELYVQAVRIEEDAARQAFVNKACGGEIELRQQVEKLLAARAAGRDNLLQKATDESKSAESSLSAFSEDGDELGETFPSHPEATGHDSTRDDAMRGQIDVSAHPTIGNYRLLEELGHGGMGTVYMAQQTKPVKRQVALKVIKPGMDSNEVIARFEAERQALAMMDHPHIARVLDGGTTDEGRPYFVMELVRGVPITEFCQRKSLPFRQRLELFGDICHAVQHAHQKGIIHRDLKPSNIMVTLHDGKPVVKVIDFGVAKALHQELTERTLFTHFSQMVGTPLYMAPEQAEMSGLGVDTRSDIYSLGVVLYELLTGTTPFDRDTMSKLGIDGIRKLIQEQEPPRPSARVSTVKAANGSTIEDQRKLETRDISKQLKGELDWIVMKALEKDRERRYESANAFAADVQRYLNDEPVEAHPPSAAYRLRKYAKKHRGLLATAALLIAMLLTSTAVSGVFAFKAQTAQKEAENQREEAVSAKKIADQRLEQSRVDFDRALKSLDTIVSHSTSPALAEVPGVDLFRNDVLEQAMSFYGEIIKEHNDDPYARFQRAVAHFKIAELDGRIPNHEKQIKELNSSLSILEELMDQSPSNPDYQLAYLDSLYGRAWMPTQSLSNRRADAERGLKIIRTSSLNGTSWQREYLEKFLGLVFSVNSGFSEEAEKLAKESIKEPGDYNGRIALLMRLALTANGDGDPATAIDYLQQALEVTQRLLPQNPDDLNLRRMHVEIHRISARTYETQANNEMAETFYRATFAHAVALRSEYRHYYRTQQKLEQATLGLSLFLTRLDRTNEALEVVRESLQHHADGMALHEMHSNKLYGLEDSVDHLTNAIKEFPHVGTYYRNRQIAYRERGEYENALADANRTIDLAENAPGVYSSRASTYLAMNEFEKAGADLDRFFKLSDEHDSPSPAEYYHCYQAALLSLHFGNAGKYRTLCERMLKARYSNVLNRDEHEFYFTAWTCTLAPDALENYDPAIKLAKDAVDTQPDNQQYINGVGAILMRAGKYKEAQQQLEKALEAGETDNTSPSYSHYFLAMTEQQLGDTKEAQAQLRKANEVAESELSDSPAWNRRLTLELLRKEAESLIDDPIGDPHVD